MTIENLTLLPFLIIFLAVYVFWFLRKEKRFFEFIKDHWFYRRTFSHKISTVFYILGLVGIVLSLIDLRGPEELIKSKTANQKTILLIDTSTSMLAEDVRPNRFKKTILLARHFIKNAVGQQISVIVFSDGQKRIVPFTGDIDLLDARLQALDSMNLERGGTGLSQAIAEAIQYFRVADEELIGNILIFTDAEETEGDIDIQIPDSISVGVVGIGTARGSTIPVRDRNGNLRGNKKHKGETVITKLDEAFLKKLSSKISSYRFWIASSYSLPTSEILDFFNRQFKLKTSQNQFRVKPVLTHYLLIPSLLLMALSMLLRMKNPFLVVLVIVVMSNFSLETYAQEKEEPKKSEEILKLEKRFATGEMSKEEKLNLAQEYYKNNFFNEAETLYSETLSNEVNGSNFDEQMNRAASMFKSSNLEKGIELSQRLRKYAQSNNLKAEEENIRKNLLKAINQEASSGQQNKKDKKDQGKKDNKNQNNQNQKGEKGENDDSQDNQKNDSQGGQGKNNDQSGQQDKKDQKEKDEQNKQDQKDKEKQNNETDQEKDKQGEKNNEPSDGKPNESQKPKEIPSLLKQLVNDDNKLQKQLIDAKTQERGGPDKKDW